MCLGREGVWPNFFRLGDACPAPVWGWPCALLPPSQAPDAWAAGGWVGGGLCVRSGSGRGACHAFAQVSVEWCRCGLSLIGLAMVGGGGGWWVVVGAIFWVKLD